MSNTRKLHRNRISMNLTRLILIPLLLLLALPSFAQTEAQALKEVLIFQEDEGNREVEFKQGDKIIFFNQSVTDDSIVGRIGRMAPEGVELYNLKTKSIQKVNFKEVKAISPKNSNAGGIALIAIGAPIILLGALYTAVGLIFISWIGAAVLIPFGFLVGGILMAIFGARLIKRKKPRIILAFWKWRLVRRRTVYVKQQK